MRERRRVVPPAEQARTARRLAEIALSQLDFPLGEHIALYMAADGEADPGLLMNALLGMGKHCYLPVLQEGPVTLAFREFLPDQPLVTDSFGLLEPGPEAPEISPANLSTVFMPLVAFDHRGGRLGMGKGYYDRTFAFRLAGAQTPNLVGLAHECQRVEELEVAPWDVPLNGVITGRGYYPTM